MLKKLKELYEKYKEIISYLFFGGLTTVVNFIVYFLFANVFNIDKVASNAIAWVVAVLFAFVTNKIFVFNHHSENAKEFLWEFGSFVGCRLFSGALDIGIFALCVNVLHFNDFIVKIFTQILVIVLNYIFSKLIIFRKKK